MSGATGFELLEHTADVGIRAWGSTELEAFDQAALALVELMGVRAAGPGTRRTVRLRAADRPGLLVTLLDELLALHETESVGFVQVDVVGLSERSLVAEIATAPAPPEPVGLSVKAATYHQLALERRADGSVEVRVFVDV